MKHIYLPLWTLNVHVILFCYRVEPVTSKVEPMPIKFKSFGKARFVKQEDDATQSQAKMVNEQQQQHQQRLELESVPPSQGEVHPPRILMGIMENIKFQNSIFSLSTNPHLL